MLLTIYIKELQSFNGGDLWIDENFDKKLALVSEKMAFTSPLPGYNSVAQILAHLTAWTLSTLSILNGGKRTLTMDSPENWPSNEELQKKGWALIKEEFYASQQKLIDLLCTENDSFLSQATEGSGEVFDYYIRGLIHHDMYHLGQIGLVIKLVKNKVASTARRLNQSTL